MYLADLDTSEAMPVLAYMMISALSVMIASTAVIITRRIFMRRAPLRAVGYLGAAIFLVEAQVIAFTVATHVANR